MLAIAITQMGSDGKTMDFVIFVQHVFCGGQAPSFEYGAFFGPGEGHRSRRRQRMSIYPWVSYQTCWFFVDIPSKYIACHLHGSVHFSPLISNVQDRSRKSTKTVEIQHATHKSLFLEENPLSCGSPIVLDMAKQPSHGQTWIPKTSKT